MSVYDDTRPQAERLCTLLDTPLLPEGGYARLELARDAVTDPHVHDTWPALSSGEQALLRCAVAVITLADQTAYIDDGLRNEVGRVLLQLGSQLAVLGSEYDDMRYAADELAHDRQVAAEFGVPLADDDGSPF